MKDRILARLPEDLEYFLPALAVLHNYVVHLRMQVGNGWKPEGITMTIDYGHERNLFFLPLFPRFSHPEMLVTIGTPERLNRKDWDCVLDFRDITRAFHFARVAKKHVTESWNALFGASGDIVPQLGYLGAQVRDDEQGILIDGSLPCVDDLVETFKLWKPGVRVEVAELNKLRPATMFSMLSRVKMYVGFKSGASYLAASMDKFLLEMYPSTGPSWWLSKKKSAKYVGWYSRDFSIGAVWPLLENLWTIQDTKSHVEIPLPLPASTAELVAVK